MKNKELLNTCYKYFNRFISAEELVKRLSAIDSSKLSKKEVKMLNELIKKIKQKINDIPNEEDEYTKSEKKQIEKLLSMLESTSTDDEKTKEVLTRQIENLKKEKSRELDSYERWHAIIECITDNKYFNDSFENLTDYELLEFITQNIKAPFPPELTQEEFDRLVSVGIENDEREWLWRLAYNYEERKMSFDSIIDYYIKVKDGYYLQELISSIGEYLNIDSIIDKINDKELIEDLESRYDIIQTYVSEEQLKRLIAKK